VPHTTDANEQAALTDFDAPSPSRNPARTDGSGAPPSHNTQSQSALNSDWGDNTTDSNLATSPTENWYEPTQKSADEICRDVINQLESQPTHKFTRPSFNGCGVYALYYHGDCSLYSQITNSARSQNIPMYIGKAGPKGGRTGAFNAEYDVPKLAGRIGDHYESVQEAQNLRTNNFTFTYLKLQKPFIEFAETALINEYRPWWNSYITGLGNHDVGANRSGSEQSMWDTFHPGRYFVQKRSLVPRGTQKQVWKSEVIPQLQTDARYDAVDFPGVSGPDPFNPEDKSSGGAPVLGQFDA